MKTILIPIATIASLVFVLAGCSEAAPGATPTDAPPTATAVAPIAESREHAEAQPRLVVTFADGIEVFDLSGTTSTSIATLPLDSPAAPNVGPDGRHVYLVDGENSVVTILDAGSYAQGHGDHYHFYTREPAFRPDTIAGATPVHVVGHDGVIAVSNDGDGSFEVFDEIGLTAGGLRLTTIETGIPQHGVAVPIHDGVLYTMLGEGDEGPLPDTIVQADSDGAVVTEYTDVCPGLHGEAHLGDLVIFGCASGIVAINPANQTATFIANPDGSGDLRIGGFYADADSVVGNWGGAGVTLIDVEAGTITPVTIDGVTAAIARGSHGEILVLTTDGVLHVLDESGTEVSTVQALDPFELPEGHGGSRPAIAVAGETVAVSDPAASRLVLVDAHDWAVAGEVALAKAPMSVVATGLDPLAGEDHDHEH